MYLNDNYDHFYEATTLSAPTTPRTLKSVQEENHGFNSLPVPAEDEDTPTNQRSAIEEIRDFHIEWQKVQHGGTCHLGSLRLKTAPRCRPPPSLMQTPHPLDTNFPPHEYRPCPPLNAYPAPPERRPPPPGCRPPGHVTCDTCWEANNPPPRMLVM